MLQVKIYGERNSGTNYLELLVTSNLEVELLRYIPSKAITPFLRHSMIVGSLHLIQRGRYFGWKHGIPPIHHLKKNGSKDLVVLTTTKNPYTFLLSLYKRPYHGKSSHDHTFSDFIRQPWKTIMREGMSFKKLENPIKLWNQKNLSYLNLGNYKDLNTYNFKYEDLLQNPIQELEKLKNRFSNLIPNQSGFNHVIESTKGDNLTFTDYQSYYLNGQWKSQISQEDREYINTQIDQIVMQHFNYEWLT